MAATTVETRIYDLVAPEQPGGAYELLAAADGQVYDVDAQNTALLVQLAGAKANRTTVVLTLGEDHQVLAAEELPVASQLAAGTEPSVEDATFPPMALESSVPDKLGLGYHATNLSSMAEANALFHSLPDLRSKAQCHQRAHVWAREMYNSYRSIYSMKVFLFFTNKFRREHRFRWWYHVAPMVYVNGEEIVLDPEFVDEPRTMRHWTDYFMMDPRFVRPVLKYSPLCAEIRKFSEYYNRQESAYCYTIRVPMYYYQPLDIEALEDEGTQLTWFTPWSVKNSKKAWP